MLLPLLVVKPLVWLSPLADVAAMVVFFGFFSSFGIPKSALLFFLLLMPQALHKDLGPAGPPLQRGVLVVPQSAQVLIRWLPPSDEDDPPLSGLLLQFIRSSHSEPLSLRSPIYESLQLNQSIEPPIQLFLSRSPSNQVITPENSDGSRINHTQMVKSLIKQWLKINQWFGSETR